MNRLGALLGRKWGPLPAWVWLAGGGLVLFLIRRGSSSNVPLDGSPTSTGTDQYQTIYDQSTGAHTTIDSTTGEVVDQTPQGTPLTLSPGESVYDPNTGVLMGASTKQYEPTILQSGEAIFDPSTGKIATIPTPTSAAAGAKSKPNAPPGYAFGAKKPGPNYVGVGGGWWKKKSSSSSGSAGGKTAAKSKPKAKAKAGN